MSKNIPQPGIYPGSKLYDNMVVYETQKGALCVAMPVELGSSEVPWRGRHTVTLIKQDGTPQSRRIDELKNIFGWDGQDPFTLQDIEPGVNEFEIVGEHQEYTPEATDENPEPQAVMQFKVVFINPPGGGGVKMPERLSDADAKKVRTKYLSKFKALAGKPAAQPATAAKPAPTPAKPKSAGPPSRSAKKPSREMSQDEVWTKLVESNTDSTEDALGKLYWDTVGEIAPGKNGELSPEEWGQVADKLGI